MVPQVFSVTGFSKMVPFFGSLHPLAGLFGTSEKKGGISVKWHWVFLWLNRTNVLNAVQSKNQDNLQRITFGLGHTARTVLAQNVLFEDRKLGQRILPQNF